MPTPIDELPEASTSVRKILKQLNIENIEEFLARACDPASREALRRHLGIDDAYMTRLVDRGRELTGFTPTRFDAPTGALNPPKRKP